MTMSHVIIVLYFGVFIKLKINFIINDGVDDDNDNNDW